jgi:hypothetical protein
MQRPLVSPAAGRFYVLHPVGPMHPSWEISCRHGNRNVKKLLVHGSVLVAHMLSPNATEFVNYFKWLTCLTRHISSLHLSESSALFPASNDSVWAGFCLAVDVYGSASKTPWTIFFPQLWQVTSGVDAVALANYENLVNVFSAMHGFLDVT